MLFGSNLVTFGSRLQNQKPHAGDDAFQLHPKIPIWKVQTAESKTIYWGWCFPAASKNSNLEGRDCRIKNHILGMMLSSCIQRFQVGRSRLQKGKIFAESFAANSAANFPANFAAMQLLKKTWAGSSHRSVKKKPGSLQRYIEYIQLSVSKPCHFAPTPGVSRNRSGQVWPRKVDVCASSLGLSLVVYVGWVYEPP